MFDLAQKKQISYVTYMRHKREIDALYTMGYRYDMEQDPVKKAEMEKEIIRRCDKLKPKLGLKDISDEEARKLLGVNFGSTEKVTEAISSMNEVTEDMAGMSQMAEMAEEQGVTDSDESNDSEETGA